METRLDLEGQEAGRPHLRFLVGSLVVWLAVLSGCERGSSSSTLVGESTAKFAAVTPIPASFEDAEELLTRQVLTASLREQFVSEWEIKVHEIAAVDREGERPGSRVYGEAVVEVANADHRLLTMAVCMRSGDSKPIRWVCEIWNICELEPREVTVTNQPTDEELGWFREHCRVVRALTWAGAEDEPVSFRYGYVNPERTWPKTPAHPSQ